MAKTRPSHPRPLTFRFLTGLVHALAETRSQAQKPTHKGLEPKWPEAQPFRFKALMLRFLTAPVHALLASYRVLREDTS